MRIFHTSTLLLAAIAALTGGGILVLLLDGVNVCAKSHSFRLIKHRSTGTGHVQDNNRRHAAAIEKQRIIND